MNTKKEKLEDFKTAISSTVKSLSNSQKIQVSFGTQSSNMEKNSIKLPDLSRTNNKFNYEEIRAIADSKSLNYRFSDKKIFKQFEPEGNISKKLYNISEKIRCEKIGTSYFKGVKNNIEKFYNKRISELDLKNSEDKIIESINSLSGVVLEQQTPKRVSHRRAAKTRKRIIVSISDVIVDNQEIQFSLRCEAGTYVKELVHSDEGRTVPSVKSVIDRECEVLWLDVNEIHAD